MKTIRETFMNASVEDILSEAANNSKYRMFLEKSFEKMLDGMPYRGSDTQTREYINKLSQVRDLMIEMRGD